MTNKQKDLFLYGVAAIIIPTLGDLTLHVKEFMENREYNAAIEIKSSLEGMAANHDALTRVRPEYMDQLWSNRIDDVKNLIDSAKDTILGSSNFSNIFGNIKENIESLFSYGKEAASHIVDNVASLSQEVQDVAVSIMNSDISGHVMTTINNPDMTTAGVTAGIVSLAAYGLHKHSLNKAINAVENHPVDNAQVNNDYSPSLPSMGPSMGMR